MLLFDIWKLGKKIGAGSFGEVWEGKDTRDGSIVAVKLEILEKGNPSQLNIERKAYSTMGKNPFVPTIHYFGSVDRYQRALVMEKLGPSLEQVVKKSGGKLSETDAAVLGLLGVEALQAVHNCGIVHRDIKPQNICLVQGETKVKIIDFGLCKKYLEKDGRTHIPVKRGKRLTGTPRYASLRVLAGYEQSRRDDLEGFTLCLLYFVLGRLPWQGQTAATKSKKHAKIYNIKKNITFSELTAGLRAARQWTQLLEYTRNLAFEEEPNYTYYADILKQIVVS
jgi:serine/threonine protein kinase